MEKCNKGPQTNNRVNKLLIETRRGVQFRKRNMFFAASLEEKHSLSSYHKEVN